ncbi:MFS transporter [Oerskovia sp. Root918]|uniref:MFS transporter n=1 Tax=unclassified Oerskovia TaxID=2619021 RepID=UPI0006FF31E8|nr:MULTISPECIES: MFS transporter [unclassified Oerskovia]KRC37692.1 MFS transporter [Oerskovia sp. Root22]KRD41062.1 MFS transporter [Oerskovia sp. Root918]
MTSDEPQVRTAASPRSLIHHRDFRYLWGGDALGQLGAQLTGFVLPIFAVSHLHATEWQMGALNAAETAAFLLLSLPAGAWVDRMRKRRVLVAADLARATILSVVVVAALTGNASMALLIGAAVIISTFSLFFDVAHQSYVPGLVGLDHVVEGNSKLQATQSVAMIAGPAIGGVALRVLSAPLVMVATVGTYLASAFAMARISHREDLPSPENRRPLRTEIAEGLRFVASEPLLRRILACTSLSNLGGAIGNAVVVIFALRTLDVGTATYGVVLSASAAGGLLGAVLADRASRWVGPARIIPVSAVFTGLSYAITPAAAVVAVTGAGSTLVPVVLVVGGFVFNLAVVVYNVAQVSFRQRLCPPALLGRMNASARFIVWGPIPIGGLLGGWIGTVWGVAPALWIGAVVMTLGALPVLLSPLSRMTELPVPAHD